MTSDQLVVAVEEESKKWTRVLDGQQKKIDDIEKSTVQISNLVRDDSARKSAAFESQRAQTADLDARLQALEKKNDTLGMVNIALLIVAVVLEGVIILVWLLK